jgi:hypothetical protein
MSFLRRLGVLPAPKGVVLDETTLEQVATLDAGGHHGDVAASADAVWFSTWDDRSIARIDPATRAETQRVEMPEKPLEIAVDERGPVVRCEEGLIVRVDPGSGALSARAVLPDGANGLVAEQGGVWVYRAAGMDAPYPISLIQLDPATLATLREVPVGSSRFGAGVWAGDGVVVALVEDPPGAMAEAVLDIRTGERLPADRAPRKKGIAERDGIRWLGDGDAGFKRVEIASGRELAKGKAPGPYTGSVVLAHGALWVCNYRAPQRGEPAYMS